MKKTAAFIITLLIYLAGCNSGNQLENLEQKLIKRVDQDEQISEDGKEMIKNSGILSYVVETYKEKLHVEKITIDDVEHEDQQPYIKLSIREKGKEEVYLLSCGINNRKDQKCERVNDEYLLNVISSGARRAVEPYVKQAFAETIPEYYVVAEPGKKIRSEMVKSGDWDYSSYQEKVPLMINFRVDDSPTNDMYEKMYQFLSDINNDKNMKIDSILFYYMNTPISQYEDADIIKILQVDQYSMDHLNSVSDLKKLEIEDGPWRFIGIKNEMVQQQNKN